jgi:outer membrane protein OmpA-like peptidoglycan-associated protein
MKTLTAILLIALLSGCVSMHSIDPHTGEEKINNTTKGAAIGATGLAAVGAVIGAVVCGSECAAYGAAAGGSVGLMAGGGTGYYMDKQEEALRERLVSTGVQIERDRDHINLVMPGNITFHTDSADIQRSFYSILDSVILVLNEYDETRIVVSGYTDSTGSFRHNQLLSEGRAKSVASYLTINGIDRQRLYPQGMSERFPIASNSNSRGRSLNRRVEVTIVQNEE